MDEFVTNQETNPVEQQIIEEPAKEASFFDHPQVRNFFSETLKGIANGISRFADSITRN